MIGIDFGDAVCCAWSRRSRATAAAAGDRGSDQLASSLCSWWDSLKAGSNAAV